MRRFLSQTYEKCSTLEQRIFDFEARLRVMRNKQPWLSTTERDSEAIRMSLSMSVLKKALQSLQTQLGAMLEHLYTLPTFTHGYNHECQTRIGSRLKAMISELESKSRDCKGLLKAEANCIARGGARANISMVTA